MLPADLYSFKIKRSIHKRYHTSSLFHPCHVISRDPLRAFSKSQDLQEVIFSYLSTCFLLFSPKSSFDFNREECECTPVRLFVIMSMQRSGSGWFETLLNSHPNVSSNGEIFSVKQRRSNISTIQATLDTVYALEWVSSAAKNDCVAAVGLKWMLNQVSWISFLLSYYLYLYDAKNINFKFCTNFESSNFPFGGEFWIMVKWILT